MGRKGTRFLEMEIEIVQRRRGVAFMLVLAHAFLNSDYLCGLLSF